jgi:hypothetical protein
MGADTSGRFVRFVNARVMFDMTESGCLARFPIERYIYH